MRQLVRQSEANENAQANFHHRFGSGAANGSETETEKSTQLHITDGRALPCLDALTDILAHALWVIGVRVERVFVHYLHRPQEAGLASMRKARSRESDEGSAKVDAVKALNYCPPVYPSHPYLMPMHDTPSSGIALPMALEPNSPNQQGACTLKGTGSPTAAGCPLLPGQLVSSWRLVCTE